MTYLLDTAVFLWSVFEQGDRLTPTVTALLKNPENSLLLSAASIWEMAIKFSLGKLEIATDPTDLVTVRARNRNLQFLSISPEHALRTAQLPFHHNDPFDRLLVAQAMIEGLPILTPDPSFRKYDVEVVW